LLVMGPFLREWESAALLIGTWFSAPPGALIADYLRRAVVPTASRAGQSVAARAAIP